MFHFTVIIPTRNRVEMLMRAVKSVRQQSFSNLEIIVVDDSPENNLQEKCGEFLREHGVTCVYSGGNRGGAVARNLGLEKATGELVAFLDDDDWWVPSKLQKQFSLMQDSSAGLCYTGVNVFKSDNSKHRCIFHAPGFQDQYKSIMKKNFIGTTSSIVTRKSILEKIGGFDTRLKALQDYDFYIRILKNWKVVWNTEPLTFYFDHSSSDKVSGSRTFYLQAAAYLRKKYENDPYYKMLDKSLKKLNS